MKLEVYEVDHNKIREGINKLMKDRINYIINHGGPLTLASAIDNYKKTEQLAIKVGVDVSEYNNKVDSFLREIFGGKK